MGDTCRLHVTVLQEGQVPDTKVATAQKSTWDGWEGREMVNASVRDVCLLQSGAVILFKG